MNCGRLQWLRDSPSHHDVMLWALSLRRFRSCRRARNGWAGLSPGPISFGGDLNFEFNVSIIEEHQCEGAKYNYRIEPPTSDVFRWRTGQEGGGNSAEDRLAAACGVDAPAYDRDRPGMSVLVFEDGVVYHTYSTYARGVDPFFGLYHGLDCAPKVARNGEGASGGAATTSATSADRHAASWLKRATKISPSIIPKPGSRFQQREPEITKFSARGSLAL